MHDLTNTVNGKVGFIVVFQDGTRTSERDVTWDEVAHKPIASLIIADFANHEYLVELSGYDKFFFANEAVSIKSRGGSILTAKMIGGVKGQSAVECRIDLPSLKRSQRQLERFPYAETVFRPGA